MGTPTNQSRMDRIATSNIPALRKNEPGPQRFHDEVR